MESLFVVILFHRKVFTDDFRTWIPHFTNLDLSYWMRLMLGGYLTVTKSDTWHGSRIRYWQNRSKSLPSKNAESDVACEKRRFSSLRRRKQTFLLSEEKRLISQAKSDARKRQSGLSSLHEMRCFSIRPRSDLKMGLFCIIVNIQSKRENWLIMSVFSSYC